MSNNKLSAHGFQTLDEDYMVFNNQISESWNPCDRQTSTSYEKAFLYKFKCEYVTIPERFLSYLDLCWIVYCCPIVEWITEPQKVFEHGHWKSISLYVFSLSNLNRIVDLHSYRKLFAYDAMLETWGTSCNESLRELLNVYHWRTYRRTREPWHG